MIDSFDLKHVHVFFDAVYFNKGSNVFPACDKATRRQVGMISVKFSITVRGQYLSIASIF